MDIFEILQLRNFETKSQILLLCFVTRLPSRNPEVAARVLISSLPLAAEELCAQHQRNSYCWKSSAER